MLQYPFKKVKVGMGIPILILLITSWFVHYNVQENIIKNNIIELSKSKKIPKKDRIDLAMEQEFEMTRDPKLNLVPRKRLFEAKKKIQEFKRNKDGIPGINWEERGPINIGGRTRSILIDADDPSGNTVFAGSVGGGLWKTTNALSNNPVWLKVDDFFESLAIGGIAQDPGNPDIIYFGTGEGYFNGDAIAGMGIWKSTDGGLSFDYLEATDNSDFDYVQGLVINDSGDVFAATRRGGIQRSTDGGVSWTKVVGDGDGADVDRIADIELSANGDLFAAMGIFQTDGIYKSEDNGDTWTKLQNGLPDTNFERIELACAPSNSDAIYALLQDKSSRECKGIYKSTDGGLNWVEKTNPSALGMSNFTRNQAWYNLSIAVDPNDEETLMIGGIDILKSTNGASSWNQISQWYGGGGMQYVHADQHEIVYKNSDIVFFGNDGGIYVTENGSDAVPAIDGLNIGYNVTQFYSGAIHPDIGTNYFLAGAQDNGTQKFEDEGMNNTSEATGGDGGFCHIDQESPNVQITTYVYNNYRVSTNGGVSFSNRNFYNNGRFINPFAYDDDEKKIYAAFKSNKYFRWNNPANAGSSSDTVLVSELNDGLISHVAVSPNIEDRIYFGTGSGEVVYVDNAHTGTVKTGVEIRNGIGYISCLAIEEGDEDHILLTLSNYGVTSIYETTNGGTNWTAVEGNLPDMPVRWVIFNPNNSDQALIGTELGVWSTDDLDGSSTVWEASNSGLANVRVDMLKVRESDSEIIAATHGRGLFSTDHFSLITASFDLAANSSSEYSNSGNAGPCNENSSQVIIPVHLNKSPNSNVTVNISVGQGSDAVEGEDFTLETPSLIFTPGGPTTKNVILNLIDDVMEESDENFILNMSVNGGEPGENPSYSHTILNDDKDPLTAPAESDYDIGTGTSLLGNAPFKGFYEDERSQFIIKVNELSNSGLLPGELSKIALEIQAQQSTQDYQNFNIKLKHTSTNEFTSSSQNFETGLTTVYSGVFDPQLGWNEFVFDNPFNWNGTDNLLVEICFNNTSWTADDIVYATESGYNSGLYRYADGSVGCSFTSGSQLLSLRPNFRFTQALIIDVGDGLADKSGELLTGETAHFYDDNGKLILSIKNTGLTSIGCLDVEIDNYGLGQLSPDWLSGFSHTEKTFYVDADQDADYDITLYYSEEELTSWPEINLLGIIKTDLPIDQNTSSEFELIENVDLSIENFGDDNNYAITGSFSGFSGFALSDFIQIIVPLDLIDFGGTNKGTYNHLTWETANERNLKKFVIERSLDGFEYEKISDLTAKGDGSYQFKDYHLTSSTDLYYYRLKMIDRNGDYETSSKIVIAMDVDNLVSIFPNPVVDFVQVQTKGMKVNEIHFYNMEGKKILSKNNRAEEGQPFHIDLSGLQPNVYMIEIISINDSGNLVYTRKKMIKNSY